MCIFMCTNKSRKKIYLEAKSYKIQYISIFYFKTRKITFHVTWQRCQLFFLPWYTYPEIMSIEETYNQKHHIKPQEWLIKCRSQNRPFDQHYTFKGIRLWLECCDSEERSACETHQLPDLIVLSACWNQQHCSFTDSLQSTNHTSKTLKTIWYMGWRKDVKGRSCL